MNLKEIEYIVKIAEERNLTRAAEKLFITPSALTQQLNHLEKDIGTPLFFRSRNGWTPTEAGEIYLKTAREMINMRNETYKQLQDIVTTRKGLLSVGFPPERGVPMFTSVYPDFHHQFPSVTVQVSEVSVRMQQAMIAKGELDIGFMSLCENHQTDDEYIFIAKEELLLAVPSAHPICKSLNPATDIGTDTAAIRPEIDLDSLSNEPFARMYKGSTIREFVDEIFRQESFQPTVLFETSRPRTILQMVASGMCCGMVPGYYADRPHPGVTFFSLSSHPSWNIMASCKKGSYLNQAAKYFIKLAREYWTNLSKSSGYSGKYV